LVSKGEVDSGIRVPFLKRDFGVLGRVYEEKGSVGEEGVWAGVGGECRGRRGEWGAIGCVELVADEDTVVREDEDL